MLPALRLPTLLRINRSSEFIFFGLYYGFLATLPIGPSQLLSIRAFLLEGNLGGAVAIGGSIVGQLIIFSSVYYSPLYVILIKPHTLTLLVLPYILSYWCRAKDLLNYQSLRPIASLQDIRIYKLFFDSIIFQLLNPILLPSPVLARLLNLFPSRYSNNVLFLAGTISGWFCGQYLFITLGKSLLFRIESDSPILYLLVKRIIHRTFSIIILSSSPLYLGRTPVPFITKKIIDNLRFNSAKREEPLLSQKLWPSLFFDHRRLKRPLRYIGNGRFSTQSPMKKKVSQYFFNLCLSDGKQKLSFTYLPGLAILGRNFERYFNCLEFLPSRKFFGEWISTGKEKKMYIYNEFRHRVEFLENGFLPGEIVEKRAGLSNSEGEIFTKFYDPLLAGQGHEAMMVSKSPWLLTKKYNKLEKRRKPQLFLEKSNKLKAWISNQWQESEYHSNFILPWEPLTRDARRVLGLLIGKSKKIGFDANSKQVNSSNGDATMDSSGRNTSGDMRKRVNRKSNVNWELILNLSPRQKVLCFNYLQIDGWNTPKNSWRNLSLGNTARGISSLAKTLGIGKKFRFQEMDKEIPRWASDLKNDKFDVIAIGVTDIRQRKVKNLGYLVKGRDKRRKIVRRFSQQSDFRRKLVKGSIRARRRKTLIWRAFQLKIDSPFFLRMGEKPTFVSTSSNTKNISGPAFRNILEKRDKNSFGGKTLVFKRTKRDRLAIANRWDFPLAQWGRSWLLIIQSHFRKYIILTTAIILKNVSRLLLLQNPEWDEDWSEWNREIHIRCTYDGTEVSEKELPEQWLRDGLQIKIIYPFRFKPWHNTKSGNKNLRGDGEYSEELVERGEFHHCYLTAWGFLTDLPFGNTKKQPPFWKPINRESRKRWKRNIFLRFLPMEQKSSVVLDVPDPERFDVRIERSPGSGKKYRGIDGINGEIQKLSTEGNENPVLKIPKKSECETLIYIQNLEDFVAGEDTRRKVYFGKSRRENSCFDTKGKKLKSVKRLIQIERVIIRFHRKNIESIKKWFSLLGVNIQRIGVDLRVGMEIIKESIGDLFSNN